jgi:predicted O-methyltransferase YrrM
MDDERWAVVDRYFANRLVPHDDSLAAAVEATARAGFPPHELSPLQGKLLHLLAKAMAARKVLEIGTLGGYSTIWLARALPPDGKIITLESNPAHADVARDNLERAGVSELVEVRVGRAADTLPQLVAEGRGPFDLIFIDADKASNPEYLSWSLRLSRPGTLLIGDNVVRSGGVADAASADPNIQGVRRFIEMLATEPRVSATAIQTVGSKGYDGFALAIVGAE